MTDLVERLLRAAADTRRTSKGGMEYEARLFERAATALEAAREDSKRMDWLDTKRGDDVRGSYPDEPELVGYYWSIDGQFCDVRAAIDAARKEVGDE